jgi:hypothetical protein
MNTLRENKRKRTQDDMAEGITSIWQLRLPLAAVVVTLDLASNDPI